MPAELKARILVVDDHVEMARLLADQLTDEGYAATVATSGAEALAMLHVELPDVVITDLRMEGVDGLDLLDRVRESDPTVAVLIMTAFGAIDSAIEAVKRGASHYFTKPFQLQEVLIFVERALAERKLRHENRSLRRLVGERAGLQSMVGGSMAMRRLYDLIERVAPTNESVLIRGESGSGKELVARALHWLGPRQRGPFVAVNCTALPEALLESELFGHVRGAFTGATLQRRGLFVEADGGTLFLDEIGDMAPALQSKLLRVLETREVRAVGADSSRHVDVRVVASTHQPLEQRVSEGRFREDLFYRLNVVPVYVPPLRERLEDLPALVGHFITVCREANPESKLAQLAPELMARLSAYPWPGNVRELENVVKRLVIFGTEEVAGMDDLAAHAPSLLEKAFPLDAAKQRLPTLKQLEDEYLAWVIAHCGGNKTRAADILGIDVSTIHRRERGRS